MHNVTRALKSLCLAVDPFAWGAAPFPKLAQVPVQYLRHLVDVVLPADQGVGGRGGGASPIHCPAAGHIEVRL